MRIGDIVLAKSVEHRIPVEITEGKNGKQRVTANRIGFKFQSEHNQISTVGVFIFLGTYPEQADGGEKAQRFAEQQLRRLGWDTPIPSSPGE